MTQEYKRQDPDHQTTFLPTQPEFSIRYLRGTSTNRGYHQSYYEVISSRELTPEDFERLNNCHLLGTGQAYDVMKSERITVDAPPVTRQRSTGLLLPDVPPTNWAGVPITRTVKYDWYRYEVRRICDSGD